MIILDLWQEFKRNHRSCWAEVSSSRYLEAYTNKIMLAVI
jgi:hypothetical protein